LRIALAVAETLAASRTVISTAVSAVTAFATTVKLLPVTLAVTGNATLLLENAL
jgi:hypothetical protein